MVDKVPAQLTHRLADLNPFRSAGDEGGEELGADVTEASVAGGGRRADDRRSLHVSHALRHFLLEQGLIGEQDVGEGDDEKSDRAPLSEAVLKILDKPQVAVPAYVNDTSHSLSEYFVSSSHNTYLTANQLTGKSSPAKYAHTLSSGARCVEADVWDDASAPDQLKVTHGYTMATHVPLRDVVRVIRATIDREAAEAARCTDGSVLPPLPVLLSLECHCGAAGQKRLVEIMREEWGDRLVGALLPGEDGKPAEDIKLSALSGKIVVMVEWYAGEPEAQAAAAAIDASSSDEEDPEAAKRKRAAEKKEKIIPELAALGCYAASVKPPDDAWLRGTMTEPPNHLINVSEVAAAKIAKERHDEFVRHNAQHLVRVYPKGTRITSHNLYPVTLWNAGAQVCALNWQTFDASMQLNDAMFAGTSGWALKPAHLRRGGGAAPTGQTKLSLEVVGATDLPVPAGHDADDMRPYVTCSLYHPLLPTGAQGQPEKRKTDHYRIHKLGWRHRYEQPPPRHAVWRETLEWDPYPNSELVFLRILVKSDDRFKRNPVFAVVSMRLACAPEGYTFLRLLDLSGRETTGTLLVKFTQQAV